MTTSSKTLLNLDCSCLVVLANFFVEFLLTIKQQHSWKPIEMSGGSVLPSQSGAQLFISMWSLSNTLWPGVRWKHTKSHRQRFFREVELLRIYVLLFFSESLQHPWLRCPCWLSPFCPLQPVLMILTIHNHFSLETHLFCLPLLKAAQFGSYLRKNCGKASDKRHQHPLLEDSGRWVRE